jgi:hypothetical protein
MPRILKQRVPPPLLTSKKAEIDQKKGRKDQDFKKQEMLAWNKQKEMATVKKRFCPHNKKMCRVNFPRDVIYVFSRF